MINYMFGFYRIFGGEDELTRKYKSGEWKEEKKEERIERLLTDKRKRERKK